MPVTIGRVPAKQPDRVVYSKDGNTQVVQEWIGPVGLMAGLVANLRVAYDEVTSETRDGVVTVRGFNRRPLGYETEQPVVNFDLVSEQQTLDLALNPTFSGLSDAVITAVENAFNDSSKTQEEKEADITAAGGGLSALYLLALKMRGQDSYLDYTWAFTRTTTISRYYPTQINLSDHGKLWTNAQVTSYVGSGNIPLFTLPTNFTETTSQSNLGFAYRWLRFQSQVQLNSAGNFNLVEGWRLALWNQNTYAAKS